MPLHIRNLLPDRNKDRVDMAFAYFPHTDEDIRAMLSKIGAVSLDDLYADVPEDMLFKGSFDIPDAMSEMELRRKFDGLASMNIPLKVFCGAGAYDHYSPAVVPAIVSRAEFLTSYTPYQAEVSQGTLRYIFEFQTMMCMLTGLDCSNASMYDGPTSAAEALLMSVACTRKKRRVLVSGTLLPHVLQVAGTYCRFHGVGLTVIPHRSGVSDLEAIRRELQAGDVAGVMVPGINRFGIIEDLSGFADAVHAAKALLIVYSDPSSLAVLTTPAGWGADIACGDAQTLGIPLSFGGPYVGFLCCRQEHVRKLPGRIVGETVDADGRRAFALTLQAREQHIRREKATSNICSNESLMALYVTVYLSLMGPDGLKRVNDLSYGGAHYLHSRLLATGLFSEAFDKPFLKEFVLRTKVPAGLLQKTLVEKGFFGALSCGDGLVSFCVTENRTRDEIDALVDALSSLKEDIR